MTTPIWSKKGTRTACPWAPTSAQRRTAAASATNVFGAMVMYFLDANSGKYKSGLVEFANDIGSQVEASSVGTGTTIWKSQAPITSIVFGMNGGDVAAGSMFSLFGVLPRMVA